MTLAFDIPASNTSCLSRLDPRWKLAALAPAAVLTACHQTVAPAFVAWLAALALAVLGQLPAPWLARRLAWMALLLAIFLIWLPFLPDPSGPTYEFGWITVSARGLERFAVVLVKTLAVITLMLVLIATAPMHDTLKAAQALRMPAVLVQLLLMTLRYVFLLAEEFVRLRTALRVRGFRNRGNLHSWRSVGQVAGTLLVRGSERAERIGQAMRCRGFDGRFPSLHDFRTRWIDVTSFLAIVLAAGALLVWDVWRR